MTSYPRHLFGRESENKALLWLLQNQTWKLLTRNYRCKWGEIDLIFEETLENGKEVELVFVEVRARSDVSWLSAPESLNQAKRGCMRRSAYDFLARYKGAAVSTRYDLVSWDGVQWSQIKNLLL